MLTRLTAIIATVMALGAATATAAPTLTADQACYAMDRDTMTLTGAGFTPGGQVGLFLTTLGSPGIIDLSADPAGAFTKSGVVPDRDFYGLGEGMRAALPITATDMTVSQANPDAPMDQFTATVWPMVADWGVDVKAWEQRRGVARPSRTTTFHAYGWTRDGTVLFAHYTRNWKLVKTVRLGALAGDCGDLTVRMREFPFRPVPAGTYRVQFDTTFSYHKNAENYYTYRNLRVAAKDAIR